SPVGRYVNVRVCLPAELWHSFQYYSTNPLKDFQRVVFLHWHASELIELAAQRLMTNIAVNHPDALVTMRRSKGTINARSSVGILRDLFPQSVVNRRRGHEDPLGYILRHTQLLPRQVLTIMNRIFRGHDLLTNRPISDQRVRQGIIDAENVLVPEITGAFRV